ncbi:MAG: hypothetical protein AB7O52_13005 [Planctomycetota bacterium]
MTPGDAPTGRIDTTRRVDLDPRFRPRSGSESGFGRSIPEGRDLGSRDLGSRDLGYRDLGYRDLGSVGGRSTQLRVESDLVREMRQRFGLRQPGARSEVPSDLPPLRAPFGVVGPRVPTATDPAADLGPTPSRGAPSAVASPRGRLILPGGEEIADSSGQRGSIEFSPRSPLGSRRVASGPGGLDSGGAGRGIRKPVGTAVSPVVGSRGGTVGGVPNPTAVPVLGRERPATSDLLRATPNGVLGPVPTPVPVPGGTAPPPVSVVTEIVGQAGLIGGSSHHHGLVHHHYRHPHFYVSFPFVGYYAHYFHPYVSHYGCDFYGRFGFRFGRFHLRLYSVCGLHTGHHYHHCHRYSCALHGYHHYRSRDCYQCYPRDHTYVIEQRIERESPEANERIQDLRPAELSFCEGFVLLGAGDYEGAADSFYNASLELPESGLIHFYLGLALAARGEVELATAVFAEAYELSPRVLTYSTDPALHFGDRDRFLEVLAKVADYRRLSPAKSDGWITGAVLGLFGAQSPEEVAAAKQYAGEATLFDRENVLGLALWAEADRRERGGDLAGEGTGPDLAVQFWLARPACESIAELRLGAN